MCAARNVALVGITRHHTPCLIPRHHTHCLSFQDSDDAPLQKRKPKMPTTNKTHLQPKTSEGLRTPIELLEVKDVPQNLLNGLKNCPQFLELVSLPNTGAYSTSSHFKNVNLIAYSKSKRSVRPQEIVVAWQEVCDSLKVDLAAFIGCNIDSLTSISFHIFNRSEGIDGHCDQAWVGDSFWGFSIVLLSEPSSALPYNLVFRTKKTATVVGEHVVRSNSAYHCSGNNRHTFNHDVAPASAGRRFFVRVGQN